ncbi:MAG: hypothetical protein BGO69_08150 [Bacteroidetes bacterium 46-16]|nr:MAG: hypothetical protein BGO69_08150 [Bacteroidetes bacterium 46-16]
MNLSFFIARRYMLRHKGAFASFIIRLAILASALSVAVMIISVGFITGFKYTIREKMFSFMGHVHVVLRDETEKMATAVPVKGDSVLVKNIERIPHVTSVSPFIIKPAIVHTNGEMEALALKGIDSSYHFMQGASLSGSNIDFTDTAYSKQVVLSQTIADRLFAKAGDTVELYFLEGGSMFPRIRKARVAGIFHTGLEEIDKTFALCDIRMLQRINNWMADDISGYQVDLDNDKYSDTVAANIFYNFLPVASPLSSYSMRDIYPNVFDWLEMQNVNVVILLVIMSVVAIINMSAVLLILMVDRARLVGLLKALGLPAGNIRNIFLGIAGIIGLSGVILGNIIGLGICLLQQKTGFIKLSESIYGMSEAAVRIVWWEIVLIDVATLALCILCMWLPALYIRRISPAKVLEFK